MLFTGRAEMKRSWFLAGEDFLFYLSHGFVVGNEVPALFGLLQAFVDSLSLPVVKFGILLINLISEPVPGTTRTGSYFHKQSLSKA
jgi:hypothetical protein